MKKISSLSKTMGMLHPCNLLAAIIVAVQYSLGTCDTKTLFCRQFGNIHFDLIYVLLTCVLCSHCKFTRLIIADRTLVHDRSCCVT